MSDRDPADLAYLMTRLRSSEVATAHPDIVARLDQAPPGSSPQAAVVVVGEKKRGKSSLINALLRRPGLLPVDVDIATSCYLGVSSGQTERAVAYGQEAPEGRDIELTDIPEWASVEGNRVPGSQPPALLHPGVTAVRVEVPDELLGRGLTLVDTPGVGGLEAGHTEITLAILRGADSVLFVVDPDSALRRSELEFLAAATERVAQVAFVMTKVDRYASWRDVLEENRSRLAQSAPHWTDSAWFDVSSLVAYDAAEAADEGDASEAEALWGESGYDRLEAYLAEQVAGRATTLRADNALHQLRGVIDLLAEAERLALAAAGGDPTLRDRLGEQQVALSSMLATDAGWPVQLATALDEVRSSLQKQFRAELRTIRASLHDRLAVGDLPLSSLPDEIDATLRAMWLELTASLRDRATAVLVLLAGELEASGSDVLTRELAYPERLSELPELQQVVHGAKDFGDSLDEFMPVAFAAGGAVTLLSTVLAIVNPFTAVAMGIGAGLARRTSQIEKRNLARERATGAAYVNRFLEQAADDIGEDLQRAVNQARQECETTVRSLLQRRRTEVEAQVRSLKQQVRADEATAAVLRKQTDHRLDELAAIRADLATADQAG